MYTPIISILFLLKFTYSLINFPFSIQNRRKISNPRIKHVLENRKEDQKVSLIFILVNLSSKIQSQCDLNLILNAYHLIITFLNNKKSRFM